ncbi:hypothetical protein N7494_003667 [Penicillium frequentans]|uniref:SMP-30/Gluconolactonase/LRE-like region domain-containing protein n=1 Tax=Penicillium frequentans TaxID=3151616 RepID=A0AAD6CZ72_9EURO|nr:hypothetical protein N7494_003667 [Penicillium glabrum]
MDLSGSLFPSFSGTAFSYLSFFGLNQQQASPDVNTNILPSDNDFLNNVPLAFEDVSITFVKDNLAVIPGEWVVGGIKTPFYDIQSDQSSFQDTLAQVKSKDFIAWDHSFFNIIGQQAKLEKIQSFEGEPPHVHEAPAYVPETNELFYADTSVTGWLWAINVDTHETRKVETTPPLANVNGARYHKGHIYLTTNGGPARGIYALNPLDGTATPVVNNFRGRHFNSPNDLIFDFNSNIWFTDPPYGWYQGFPDVQVPELPNGIYFFNTKTKALVAVSNSVVTTPNGLAFSNDGSILYVADSNSTAGRPLAFHPASLRNVWAFDVTGSILSNARLVHQTESGWPDGLQVTQDGYVLVAVLGGVDVIDPYSGILLGKINTPDDIIFNLERGPQQGNQQMWLLTGQNYIYKLMMDLSER